MTKNLTLTTEENALIAEYNQYKAKCKADEEIKRLEIQLEYERHKWTLLNERA